MIMNSHDIVEKYNPKVLKSIMKAYKLIKKLKPKPHKEDKKEWEKELINNLMTNDVFVNWLRDHDKSLLDNQKKRIIEEIENNINYQVIKGQLGTLDTQYNYVISADKWRMMFGKILKEEALIEAVGDSE
jgi:hypothetical protein